MLKDLKEIFGSRLGKTIFIITILFSCIIALKNNSNELINLFKKITKNNLEVISLNQLIPYIGVPLPNKEIRNGEEVVDGFTMQVPLILTNITSEPLIVNGITIKLPCLSNFNNSEFYSKNVQDILSGNSNAQRIEILRNYEGGSSEGWAYFNEVLGADNDLDDLLKDYESALTYAPFPIIIPPLDKKVIFPVFTFSIISKDRHNRFIAKLGGLLTEEFINKLFQLFLGARNEDDVTHQALLTFHTNKGILEKQEVFDIIFVGTHIEQDEKSKVFYLPKPENH